MEWRVLILIVCLALGLSAVGQLTATPGHAAGTDHAPTRGADDRGPTPAIDRPSHHDQSGRAGCQNSAHHGNGGCALDAVGETRLPTILLRQDSQPGGESPRRRLQQTVSERLLRPPIFAS